MTDILIPKKNIIVDSQILTALMNCSRLADFRFNHDLIPIEGKSNSLECGSIVHKFLEVYYGSIINGIKRENAVGFAIAATELYISGCKYCTNFVIHPCLKCTDGLGIISFSDELPCDKCDGTGIIKKPECNHKPNDYLGVKNTPKESEKEPYIRIGWQYVLDTCIQYCEFYRNDHWVPLEVEVVKAKVLYEDDEVRILWKAKLDLVADTNQGIFPIDHKTMKQRRNTCSMNNQFMGQCLLMNTRNVFINKIGFQTTLKPEDKFTRPPVPYSASRLIEWQSEILPYYAKLLLMYQESGYFPPNFGHCEGKYGNCDFLKICESDSGMREEELKLHFMVGPKWDPTNEEE